MTIPTDGIDHHQGVFVACDARAATQARQWFQELGIADWVDIQPMEYQGQTGVQFRLTSEA
jgi:hypothetical protein